jgi:hypothetical protein
MEAKRQLKIEAVKRQLRASKISNAHNRWPLDDLVAEVARHLDKFPKDADHPNRSLRWRAERISTPDRPVSVDMVKRALREIRKKAIAS